MRQASCSTCSADSDVLGPVVLGLGHFGLGVPVEAVAPSSAWLIFVGIHPDLWTDHSQWARCLFAWRVTAVAAAADNALASRRVVVEDSCASRRSAPAAFAHYSEPVSSAVLVAAVVSMPAAAVESRRPAGHYSSSEASPARGHSACARGYHDDFASAVSAVAECSVPSEASY